MSIGTLFLAAALAAVAGPAAPGGAAEAEKPAAPAPATPDTAQSPAPVEVRDGLVVNFAHRFYFPTGRWILKAGEADFEELANPDREGAVMRVVVSESSAPLADAVRALRDQAGSEANLHVLAEDSRRLAGREAADLLVLRDPVKNEPPVLLRTLCFVRDGKRFYFRLEASAVVYEKAAGDFETALEGLKFEFRFPWEKKSG